MQSLNEGKDNATTGKGGGNEVKEKQTATTNSGVPTLEQKFQVIVSLLRTNLMWRRVEALMLL